MEKKLKLLVKFPTRQRFSKFFEVFDQLVYNTKDIENTHFLITADADDKETYSKKFMDEIEFYREQGFSIEVIYGKSENKINAVNRDLDKIYYDWDILLLMSDDMYPYTPDYDEIIRKAMMENFPDTDGVLYFPDGFTPLNTLCILGKKYYDRFGYIYYPGYKSFWCDNEFQTVSQILKKEYIGNYILFKHMHPIWIGTGYDELYESNNVFYAEDQELFERRQKLNFGLSDQ